jgi:hypothetical protein
MATSPVRAALLATVVLLGLVAASSAKSASHVDLASVPLPASAIGSVAHSLPVARDSGFDSNQQSASQSSSGVTAAELKRLGRVTGYLVDYGNPFGEQPGIRQIQTEVELYASAPQARKGLDFWRRQELNNDELKALGLTFSFQRLRPSGIPGQHWVYGSSISIKGLAPLYGVDAQLQQGKYLLDVSVAGSSIPAAAKLIPALADKLDQRLQRALAGHLPSAHVKVPAPLQPGPPASGPKPADLVLKPADVGSATVIHKGYSKPKDALDDNAVSVYDLAMTSTGSYRFVTQEVLVGSNGLEAQYFGAIALGAVTAAFGKQVKVTPVDLSGVGDNGRGDLLKITVNGKTASEAVLVLNHGTYLAFAVAASASALTASDAQSLVHLMAKRLDAGF